MLEGELNLQAAGSDTPIEEVAADKGYHAAVTRERASSLGLRTYIPEPQRPHRSRWQGQPAEWRAAVEGNRRRMRGARGKRLQRQRSELVERSFAHVCETGGARRCWLWGLEKVRQRYLLQAAARNLGLILRKLFGMGTPRGLQPEGASDGALDALAQLINPALHAMCCAIRKRIRATTTRIQAETRQPASQTLAT